VLAQTTRNWVFIGSVRFNSASLRLIWQNAATVMLFSPQELRDALGVFRRIALNWNEKNAVFCFRDDEYLLSLPNIPSALST
jgi:hypothetical protein